MKLLHKDTVTLRRTTDGHYSDDGQTWVDVTEDITIKGCLQPDFSGKQRYIEEAGVRSEDCYLIDSKTQLKTVDEYNDLQADLIIMADGSVWEAKKTRHWTTLGHLSHYEVIIVRQDKDFQNGRK